MKREYVRLFALWSIIGIFIWGCANPDVSAVQSSSSKTPRAAAFVNVSRISAEELVGKMRITIEADGELSYTAFKLTEPLRLVLDLPNATTSNISELSFDRRFPVTRISPFQFSDGNTTNSRIEVAISRLVPYQVFSDANKLFVDLEMPVKEIDISASSDASLPPGFEELAPAAPSSSVKPLSMTPTIEPVTGSRRITPVAQTQRPTLEIETPPSKVGTVSPLPAPKNGGSGMAVVKGVQITKIDGNTRIIVSANRIPEFEIRRTDAPARLMIDLKQSSLPPSTEKKIAPEDAASVVKQARIFQLTSSSQENDNVVRVLVDLLKPMKHQVTTENGKLMIDLQGGSVFAKDEMGTGAAQGTADVPLTTGVESALTGQATETTGEGVAGEPTIRAPRTGEEREYKGQLISLHFQEADILDVLQVIAEVSGLNLVVHPDVQGKVTVHLTNIPWDQALDIILKMNQLSVGIEGNILRVAKSTIFQQEITQRIDQQQQQLRARELQQQLEPLETRLITINFADPTQIVSLINDYFAGSLPEDQQQNRRGSITVDTRTKTLIVQDTADNIKKIEEIVATLDRRTPQVMIEAKIVTLSTFYAKELGIQWLGNFNVDAQHGNALDYRFPYSVNQQDSSGNASLFGVNLPGLSVPYAGTTGWLRFGSIDDVITLFARIDAAEMDNKAKTLSQPKIFTQDNVAAEVSAGQTRSKTTIQGDSATTETKEVNLSLSVTPRISNDGYISMTVKVQNGRFTSTDTSDLTTSSEAVNSEITVKDGGTVVIGGIYTTSEYDNFKGVPFLHKIPVLGHLFKSTIPNQTQQSELLVFLTPRILDRNVIAPQNEENTEASFSY